MLYGFTGPSRSGKTSLAKAVAEELGLHFHATSTTKTALAHGYDPVKPMPLTDRIELQHILLEAHIAELKDLPRPLVVDRTPIDHLAYMLCEFHMQSGKELAPEMLARVMDYKQRALHAVSSLYDMVFLIGQLDHYEAQADKPDDNRPYHTHFELLTEGIVSHMGNRLNYAFVRTTDFDQRVEGVHSVIVQRMDAVYKERHKAAHYN